MDERGSVTLTEQRHGLTVARERGDVLLDPVQRRDDVEQRVVTGRIAVTCAQESYTCTTHLLAALYTPSSQYN